MRQQMTTKIRSVFKICPSQRRPSLRQAASFNVLSSLVAFTAFVLCRFSSFVASTKGHLCHPQVMARWVGLIPSRIIGVEDMATKTMGCPTGCAILQSEVSMGFMPLKNHKLKPQVAIELVALNNCSCKACAASALLG